MWLRLVQRRCDWLVALPCPDLLRSLTLFSPGGTAATLDVDFSPIAAFFSLRLLHCDRRLFGTRLFCHGLLCHDLRHHGFLRNHLRSLHLLTKCLLRHGFLRNNHHLRLFSNRLLCASLFCDNLFQPSPPQPCLPLLSPPRPSLSKRCMP